MKRPNQYRLIERSAYLAENVIAKSAQNAACGLLQSIHSPIGKMPSFRKIAKLQGTGLTSILRGFDILVREGHIYMENDTYIIPNTLTVPVKLLRKKYELELAQSEPKVNRFQEANTRFYPKRTESEPKVNRFQEAFTLYMYNNIIYTPFNEKASFHFALEASANASLQQNTYAAFGLAESGLKLAVGMSLSPEPSFAANQVTALADNPSNPKDQAYSNNSSLKFTSVHSNSFKPTSGQNKKAQISLITNDNDLGDITPANKVDKPSTKAAAPKKQQYVAKPKDVEMVFSYVIQFLTKQIKSNNPRHLRYKASKKADLFAISEDFFDYYESCGWKVGPKAMKNWRSAVNRWLLTTKNVNPVSSNNAY